MNTPEQEKNTFIGADAMQNMGTHNIVLGDNATIDNPGDSYMLVLGNWKQKMTPEQYAEAHKVILTCYDVCFKAGQKDMVEKAKFLISDYFAKKDYLPERKELHADLLASFDTDLPSNQS